MVGRYIVPVLHPCYSGHMTDSQRHQIRASEIRQRLNEVAALEADAVTPEIRTETDGLTAELRTVETQYRAAVAAEETELRAAQNAPGAPDAETAELRSLQDRASLGRYLRAFADGAAVDGAERELAEHRGLAGAAIPWDVLMPPAPPLAEVRADAVTPAPATGNPTNQAMILQRVFARSATARAGVYMPSVEVGTASFPLITTGQAGAFVAKDGAVEAAAGVIGENLLSPRRLQARVQFRIEDEMTTMGLDAALTEDLRLALNDRLDAQIIGAGDANVRGFLATSANGGLADYTDPGAVVTFAAAAEQAARGVDGVYSGSEAECSWIIGTESYAKLAGLIQANDSTSATERLRRILRDFMASANVPDAASNVQQGILAKLGVESAMSAVCPVWEGLRLIRDEITSASKGLIAVTGIMLHNFKVIRPAAFVRTKLKLA